MNKSLLLGIVVLASLSAVPSVGGVVPKADVLAVGAQFLPPVLAAPAGSVVRFESLETTLHHNVVAVPSGAFIGHLMPTISWTCVPGDFASTCFDITVGAPGSVLTYRCELHPNMYGAIVAV